MKRIVFYAAMAIALVTPFICAARTLSVSAPDGDGNVTITIGGEGIGDQQLIAAWANGDKGTNPTNWTEYADAGAVAAADTSKSYQLPAAWRAKSGMVRFFLMSGMPPYKTRYDYITRPKCVNGGLYIDTGIVPDKTIDITVKSQSENFDQMASYGNGDIFMFANEIDYSSQNCYVFAFLGVVHHGTGSYSASNVLLNSDTNVFGDKPPKSIAPHTFRMCRDGIYIDGYRHLGPFDDSELPNTPTSSLWLFGRNAANQKQSGRTCSIYSATIVTNGVLAHEYVPCEKSDGTVTMYDRVTQSFSVAAGTQASILLFQPGNDIGPWPTDCGDVDGVSGVVGIGPAIRIVDVDSNTHSISVSLSSGHDEGLLFAVAGASDVGETYSSWTTNMLVSKVGVGTNSVTVALPNEWWRGKYNVRFAWRSLAGRPYDYDVSYIHADRTGGDNYCRTGWKPTTNTTIHVNAKTALDVAPFGVAGYFGLFLNSKSNSQFFYVYGDKANTTGVKCNDWSTFANYYHDWLLGPTEARVDDLVIGTYSGAAPDASVTANICLPFRATSKTDHNTVTKAGNAEVKFAKIWEGDVLVRDFAPCVYTNGVPGFYDNVRGEFHPSVNAAKPFVAGDIVVADGDFVSWSPARKLGTGLVITFL